MKEMILNARQWNAGEMEQGFAIILKGCQFSITDRYN